MTNNTKYNHQIKYYVLLKDSIEPKGAKQPLLSRIKVSNLKISSAVIICKCCEH